MSKSQLSFEILTGPLDGHPVSLDRETLWTKSDDEELSFPWDEELGTPQAKIFLDDDKWYLEAFKSAHGTYCINRKEKITGKIELRKGDRLKASETWLKIVDIN